MSATMKLEGLDKVTRELNNRLKKVKTATVKGIADITLDCLGKSVQRAPVELGDLRGSGHADINGKKIATGNTDGSISSGSPGESSNSKIEGVVGFTAPYALKQHEELDYVHLKGGEAKYLEKTLAENTEKYVNHLANGVKKAIE